jgi:tetratricopeptide (TPR) repeat protein
MSHLMRLLSAALLMTAVACAHSQNAGLVHEVRFEDVVVTADLELDKLNDEELFAQGTSFYAAEEYAQAARYFGRIADFHASSTHRRQALYNAGLSLVKLHSYDDALARFIELSDPAKGTGDSLDAAFQVALVYYKLERHAEAVEVLKTIADRSELPPDKRLEARVQQGVCEVEVGLPTNSLDAAEKTLRSALEFWQDSPEKELINDEFPSQAQFYLGEIFRLHYESIILDGSKDTEKLAQDLEYKSELLLSSQGHYLRAIRMGNGYWATASGQRIGNLYENMYEHMTNAPTPSDLDAREAETYKSELRKKIRVLITKAITVYERTLEAAERIGSVNPFVETTKQSLQRMKELLLAEAKSDDVPEPLPPPPAGKRPRS